VALAVSAFAQGVDGLEKTGDAAWQRYSFLLRSSTLEWLPSEPFMLKVDYQLYDLEGRPAEKGSAEESWTQSDGRLIRIHSPSLIEDETSANDGNRTHIRENYLVRQAINSLTRPFPSATKREDFQMEEFRQMLGSSEIMCFSLVQPGKSRNPTTPAYCTDVDNHIIAMTGQLFVLERSDFRQYRGHQIPNELKLSYEGRPAISMHVVELDPLPALSVAKNKLAVGTGPIRIPGETLLGNNLSKPDPVYPKEAKKKHIGGSVLISAIITKQGTIEAMDVIASPNPLLAQAAKEAVQKWTYSPYILGGKPVEVDTTITVNFNFGR
jgi:TonB family protein